MKIKKLWVLLIFALVPTMYVVPAYPCGIFTCWIVHVGRTVITTVGKIVGGGGGGGGDSAYQQPSWGSGATPSQKESFMNAVDALATVCSEVPFACPVPAVSQEPCRPGDLKCYCSRPSNFKRDADLVMKTAVKNCVLNNTTSTTSCEAAGSYRIGRGQGSYTIKITDSSSNQSAVTSIKLQLKEQGCVINRTCGGFSFESKTGHLKQGGGCSDRSHLQ